MSENRQAASDKAYYAGAEAFRAEGHDAKNPHDRLFKDPLNAYLWHAWNQGLSDQIAAEYPINPQPKE